MLWHAYRSQVRKDKGFNFFFFPFSLSEVCEAVVGLGDVCYRKAYEFNSVYNLKALASFGYVVFMQ